MYVQHVDGNLTSNQPELYISLMLARLWDFSAFCEYRISDISTVNLEENCIAHGLLPP